MKKHMRLIAIVALMIFGAGACAASSPEPATSQPDMNYWLAPPVAPLHLRTKEEEHKGMQEGRRAPAPEFLQPPLDSGLPMFTPQLPRDTTASFVGGASDILPQLVGAWIDAFNQYYPNVRIEIGKPYAGSLGMLNVIKGTYDFVFVSRELKPTDVTSFHARYGYDPLSIPVSGATWRHYGFLDAIGVFVNVSNPVNGLTLKQIDGIFSRSRLRGSKPLRTWGDVGLTGKWANKPIHVYGIKPWNGFEEFVRQRILNVGGERGEWRTDIHFDKLAFPIAGLVAADPLGIGYTGLAYLTQGVKVLPLSTDGTRYIPASYERVADASYPLSRLIYFNVNREPGKPLNPALKEFLRFILSSQGQGIVLKQAIYLPLRHQQVANSLELLR